MGLQTRGRRGFDKAWRKLGCDAVLGTQGADGYFVGWYKIWEPLGWSPKDMLTGYVYRKQHPEVEADFLALWDGLNAGAVLGNREYQFMLWLVKMRSSFSANEYLQGAIAAAGF